MYDGQALIREALGDIYRLERRLAPAFDSLAAAACADARAQALLAGFATTARRHAEAVAARLQQLGGEIPSLEPVLAAAAVHSASAALRAAAALATEAAIAASILQPITSRFRDSAITAPSGMTGHLVRDLTQDWVAAQGAIVAILHDVVLRELEAAGAECQCTCPACGQGLCVCAMGARAAFSEAWLAARPRSEPASSALPRPRATSAAALAGLREGDRLTSIDDVPLELFPQLQTAIKAHEMGDTFPVGFGRDGRKLRVLLQRWVDLGDGPLPLDCEAPAGPAFYLDRARDLQARLRGRASSGAGPAVLARLSVRETQVLRLVANGATNPMIADKLHISRPTVARHIANILLKLEVTNRTEAAGIAAAAGMASD